ncbi:MAG: SOS response-associated peptidase [Phycisphaerae bacterium]|nr:SOS response-associated peptidase [Phycisphaerae bacterium]
MCGRFALRTPAARLREVLHFDNTPALSKRYNIAPSQEVLVVRLVQGRRLAETMRWGLIPAWSNDPAIGNRLINARAETLEQKPAFREPFRNKRCLIPADGFYEWQAGSRGGKQPFYLRRRDEQPLVFAGLWDEWTAPDGGKIRGCTIITVDAVGAAADIHTRMPAILAPEECDLWLDDATETERRKELLRPRDDILLQAHPVRRNVNDPKNDTPDCITPIDLKSDPPPTLF